MDYRTIEYVEDIFRKQVSWDGFILDYWNRVLSREYQKGFEAGWETAKKELTSEVRSNKTNRD